MLSTDPRKGEAKVDLRTPDVCRAGEIVLIGRQEAKTVVSKKALVFRFPLERDYPAGTVVRPLTDDEFLQVEGDRLCLYRKGTEEDDDAQDHAEMLRILKLEFREQLMPVLPNKEQCQVVEELWSHHSPQYMSGVIAFKAVKCPLCLILEDKGERVKPRIGPTSK